jgi:hypothetical protein
VKAVNGKELTQTAYTGYNKDNASISR